MHQNQKKSILKKVKKKKLAKHNKRTNFRAISQVVSGQADALHPEPIGGFQYPVHQDKTERGV